MLLVVETPVFLVVIALLAFAVMLTLMVVVGSTALRMIRHGWHLLPAARGGGVLIFGLVWLAIAVGGMVVALWFAFTLFGVVL